MTQAPRTGADIVSDVPGGIEWILNIKCGGTKAQAAEGKGQWMSEEKTVIRTYTSGSIPRQLFVFMLPFMASNVLQVLYSTIDMIIVGQYVGAEGLSAVSIGGQMMNFFTMLCTGLCTGGQVLISQFLGVRKKKELGDVIGTLTLFIFATGLAISVLLILFRAQLCRLLNVPDEAFAMALQYMGICAVGLLFSFGYNLVSTVLRGLGDSFHPMVFVAIASAFNLILDLLFTGYLGWGVAGAAAATMMGQAVSFLFALAFLYIRRNSMGFEIHRQSFRIDREYLRVILSQGIPMAVNSCLIYVSMSYVNRMINQAGLIESATFGVGIKIDDLCTKVSLALLYAASPIVAQNYAAKNMKRVKQTVLWTWVYGVAFHLCFMLIYLLFGRSLFRLFTRDEQILELSTTFIHSIIWNFIPMAILRGSNALIQGIGNAKLNMVLGILDGVVCRIGFSYLFGVVWDRGFSGFVLGYALAPFGAAIPGVIYFFSGIWQKRGTLVEGLEGKAPSQDHSPQAQENLRDDQDDPVDQNAEREDKEQGRENAGDDVGDSFRMDSDQE